jgi:hypothetical protein
MFDRIWDQKLCRRTEGQEIDLRGEFKRRCQVDNNEEGMTYKDRILSRSRRRMNEDDG